MNNLKELLKRIGVEGEVVRDLMFEDYGSDVEWIFIKVKEWWRFTSYKSLSDVLIENIDKIEKIDNCNNWHKWWAWITISLINAIKTHKEDEWARDLLGNK